MKPGDMTAEHVEQLRTLCRGNEQAMGYLIVWREYVEAIDDIVDMEQTASAFVIRTFGLANQLYSNPYYLAHVRELHLLVQLITCAYADSVDMEKSPTKWKRDLADVIRHAGAEMMRAVLFIEGGYDHLRQWSGWIHANCYHGHHDAEGKPV